MEARKHVHIGTCECGCNMMFFREYRTRKPRYFNNTHRKRAYRARARARAAAWRLVDQLYGGDIQYFSECYYYMLQREQDHNWQLHEEEQTKYIFDNQPSYLGDHCPAR